MLTMVMPFKVNLNQLLYGSPDLTSTSNFVICSTFCAVTCLLSIVFPNVKTVLGIFGGIASVNICFLIPLIVHVSLSKEADGWKNKKNLGVIAVFGLYCVAGWLSVGCSLRPL